MQSITKLSTKSDVEKVELEFFKLKESEGFKSKYPNLNDEKFGLGMKTNIIIIANQLKKAQVIETGDFESILDLVYEDCKKVHFFNFKFFFDMMMIRSFYSVDFCFIDLPNYHQK